MNERMAQLDAMSDEELLAASLKRVGDDAERPTRRNMKECVAEHIQTLCLSDPAFARNVMHPRKSMIHCIWYNNRKAREFIEQEMKDNDFPKENGVYGSDVPDGLCYQWAVDYLNDPNAKEDEEKEEKFVPHSYRGTGAASSKRSASSKGKSKGKDVKKRDEDTAKPKAKEKVKDDSKALEEYCLLRRTKRLYQHRRGQEDRYRRTMPAIHVPFDYAVEVSRRADREGMTVYAWLRRAVDRAME